jgi:holo-[acyl-carrier protein] synthase
MRRVVQITGAVSELMMEAGMGMPAAVGVDAVEIAAFDRDVKVAGDAFLIQCFSTAEIEHCAGDVEKLATRFALKEAALKVLGTGIRGIGLHDIEVDTTVSGEPQLRLSAAAQAVATTRNLGQLRCSATREAGLALAVVTAGPAENEEEHA